jgi:sugar/nucleoside kinase (ribokinase family)
VGGYAAQYMAQKQQKGQWDIKAAVQYGCKASARVIEHLGCLDPIVWADEVDIPRYSNKAEETRR